MLLFHLGGFQSRVLTLVAAPTDGFLIDGMTFIFGMFAGIVAYGVLDGASTRYSARLGAK